MMMEKFLLMLALLLTDNIFLLLREKQEQEGKQVVPICDANFNEEEGNFCDGHEFNYNNRPTFSRFGFSLKGSLSLLAEAKGVAGLGKAGGDGSGGSDKAGQQVPPEVYNALTYAGTAFLFTLSVPLILYSLNKLLNKIEDCFGCGPSRKSKKPNSQPGNINKQASRNPAQHPQVLHHQQQSSKNSNQLHQAISFVNNGSAPFSSIQQPALVPNASPPQISPATIAMAHEEPKLNYESLSLLQQQKQQNCQQPYIISSPNL